MRIEQDIKLDFKDVLIRPKRSKLESRKSVNILRRFNFQNSGQEFYGVPIVAANMDTVGTLQMANVFSQHSLMTAIHKHYELDQLVNHWIEGNKANENSKKFSFYTMGIKEGDLNRLDQFIKLCEKSIPGKSFAEGDFIKYLCIDVANGYTERFVSFISEMREKMPKVTIMAGNVVTGEMVEQLILAGADIVKVGIGPGSVCTTRSVTGVGYPQLSAIIECADAAHGLGGHVCADGGCQTSGDVAKAFGAGADFVMLGGMLAGHEECGGELFEEKKEGSGTIKKMRFYGMSSEQAMNRHSGGVAHYRASEGKCVEVNYKGNVENTVLEILGGLRSSCTYVGARQLKELPKRTTFVRVTQQLNPMFK